MDYSMKKTKNNNLRNHKTKAVSSKPSSSFAIKYLQKNFNNTYLPTPRDSVPSQPKNSNLTLHSSTIPKPTSNNKYITTEQGQYVHIKQIYKVNPTQHRHAFSLSSSAVKFGKQYHSNKYKDDFGFHVVKKENHSVSFLFRSFREEFKKDNKFPHDQLDNKDNNKNKEKEILHNSLVVKGKDNYSKTIGFKLNETHYSIPHHLRLSDKSNVLRSKNNSINNKIESIHNKFKKQATIPAKSCTNTVTKSKNIHKQLSKPKRITSIKPHTYKSSTLSSIIKSHRFSNTIPFKSFTKPSPSSTTVNLVTTFKSSTSKTFSNKIKNNPNYSVISLIILSNWGHESTVGLTEVQLFDKNDHPIKIAGGHVLNGNDANINRLYNNRFHSINEDDMWTSPFNKNHIKIELSFHADEYNEVDSVLLWNYNGKERNKGVKEVQIFKKNVLKYEGTVPIGTFNRKHYYAHKIQLEASRDKVRKIQSLINGGHDLFGCDLKIKGFNSTMNSSVRQRSNWFISKDKSSPIHQQKKKTHPKLPTYSEDKLRNSDGFRCMKDINFGNRNININNPPIMNTDPSVSNKNIQEQNDDCSIESINNNNNNNNYITFTFMRITFLANYGHANHIGLSGLVMYDMNGNAIPIESASQVGASPKDIASVYNILDDKRRFENIFDQIYNTLDENDMWVTIFTQYELPRIEIAFENEQTLSYIDIYNYNFPLNLDKCAKLIQIDFSCNSNTIDRTYQVLLFKGLGIIDMSSNNQQPLLYQRLYFPHCITDTLSTCNYLNMQYTCERALTLFSMNNEGSAITLLPCGNAFRCVLLSNYGHEEIISLHSITFYDINMCDITEYAQLHIVNATIRCDDYDESYMKKDNVYFERFFSFTKNEYSNAGNVICFVFDRFVSVYAIKIINGDNTTGVKRMNMYLDEDLVFEGSLLKGDNMKQMIVFSEENELTKKDFPKEEYTVINWNNNDMNNKDNYFQKEEDGNDVIILKRKNSNEIIC